MFARRVVALTSRYVEDHLKHTGSEKARELLGAWSEPLVQQFIKVMPHDYKRVLMEMKK